MKVRSVKTSGGGNRKSFKKDALRRSMLNFSFPEAVCCILERGLTHRTLCIEAENPLLHEVSLL